MGTRLDLTVEAPDRAIALAASEKAVGALEAAEARLSTWREDGELARFNRSPVGAPFALSPALAAELQSARQCWEETGGAFDPTVGPSSPPGASAVVDACPPRPSCGRPSPRPAWPVSPFREGRRCGCGPGSLSRRGASVRERA